MSDRKKFRRKLIDAIIHPKRFILQSLSRSRTRTPPVNTRTPNNIPLEAAATSSSPSRAGLSFTSGARSIHTAISDPTHSVPSSALDPNRSCDLSSSVHVPLLRRRPSISEPSNSATLSARTETHPAHIPNSPPPDGCQNPQDKPEAQRRKERVSLVWEAVKGALDMVEKVSGPFPPLKTAAAGVNAVIKRIDTFTGVQDKFITLTQRIDDLHHILGYYHEQSKLPTPLHRPFEGITSALRTLESILLQKVGRSSTKRFIEAPKDLEDVAAALRGFDSAIQTFIMEVVTITCMSVEELRQRTDMLAIEAALSKLNPVKDASRGPRGCLQGTRTKLLSDILAWICAPDSSPILWLNGMAGVGKTTVATDICNRFSKPGDTICVGFFCSRAGTSGQRDPKRIFSTLAHDLARLWPDYRSVLLPVLTESSFDVGRLSVQEQFSVLIVKPLKTINISEGQNIILLCDALDECNEGPENNTMEDLLNSVIRAELHPSVKFLCTSRPEYPIIGVLGSPDRQRSQRAINVHDVLTYPVQDDIFRYLQMELVAVLEGCGGDKELIEREIRMLAHRAKNLFIYASTSCKFIKARNGFPDKRLHSLLYSDPKAAAPDIDGLYAFILSRAFENLIPEEIEHRLIPLATIVCAFEELSISDIARICHITALEVRKALEPLLSVLDADGELVTLVHASFSDYLTDPKRSGKEHWHIERPVHDGRIAFRCLSILKNRLHFNVYHLTSSYLRDDEQPHVRRPGADIVYASKFWVEHLQLFSNPAMFAREVDDFLRHRLLFWLEVMSYEQAIQQAHICLLKLIRVFDRNDSLDLCEALQEANEFLITFSDAVRMSIPHIYLSALPFTPRTSSVWRDCESQVSNTLTVTTRRIPEAGPVITLVTGKVLSLTYSPNGAYIASGLHDHTVRIWNVRTGNLVIKPIKGHCWAVTSVSWSPDGTYIASGSDDRTVRVCNAKTGELAMDPIEGHSYAVKAVAWSPDGAYIASGSEDKTVCVWNSRTGELAMSPIEGHWSGVNSIAWSPGCAYIASGSNDEIVRVWKVRIGDLAMNSVQGHCGPIESVARSPDGAYIASGANDKMVRVRNANTEDYIMTPREGHSKSVLSISWSPDGAYIASGSFDGIICVWNAKTGALEIHKFRRVVTGWCIHCVRLKRQDCPCLECKNGEAGHGTN